MPVTNKPIGGLLVGAAAVAAAAFGVAHLLGGDDAAPETTGDAAASVPSIPPSDASLEDQLAALEQNRDELVAQQVRERADIEATLTLPPGTSFSEPYEFPALRSQISQRLELLETGADAAALADAGDVELEWWEDGAFAGPWAMDWQCAWLSTGLAKLEEGDDAGVADAVQTLHTFVDTPFVEYFPDYDTFLARTVDPLLEGHSMNAQGFLNSCDPVSVVD